MNRLGSAHPGLGTDAAHPIREAWDEAEVLADMLLADQPDRHHAAGRYRDRWPEEALQHEDAFGMMAERAMPKISGDRLRLVEPLMQRQIVLCRPAPFLHRGERVVIAMSHHRLLRIR